MENIKQISNNSIRIENFNNKETDIDLLLTKKRMETNLTQIQLSQKTGIRQSNLCRIENGKTTPNVSTLKQIGNGMDMLLKINYNSNPEKYYYGGKKNNHIIPKVYYKQWVNEAKYSNGKVKLKIINSNKKIEYKNIEKFNNIKNAFVIRFGDTFLPEIVKNKFINVIKEYKFFYKEKEYYDIDVLSNNYYLFKEWSIINKKGKQDRHGFETKIAQQSCYSIEVGLDEIFENFYNAIIGAVNEIFNGKQFDSNVVQIIIDYIIRIYLCFYLRSDAWRDLSYKLFDSIADIYFKMNKNIPITDDFRNQIHDDLRKEYLWMLLYDYENFVASFDKCFKMLRYKNIRIYKNKTDVPFATSEMPIINNEKNIFFIMSPEYLVEFVDDYVDQNRIYLYEIGGNNFIIERNGDVMKKAKEIIIYN